MRRSEQDLYLEVTLELKEITVAHEEVRYKKKVTNKQVDRLETTLGWTRLLEEISSREEVREDFLSYLKVHLVQDKAEELLKMTPTKYKRKDNCKTITTHDEKLR